MTSPHTCCPAPGMPRRTAQGSHPQGAPRSVTPGSPCQPAIGIAGECVIRHWEEAGDGDLGVGPGERCGGLSEMEGAQRTRTRRHMVVTGVAGTERKRGRAPARVVWLWGTLQPRRSSREEARVDFRARGRSRSGQGTLGELWGLSGCDVTRARVRAAGGGERKWLRASPRKWRGEDRLPGVSSFCAGGRGAGPPVPSVPALLS